MVMSGISLASCRLAAWLGYGQFDLWHREAESAHIAMAAVVREKLPVLKPMFKVFPECLTGRRLFAGLEIIHQFQVLVRGNSAIPGILGNSSHISLS
jgi:hypothetical protein